ncbi:MAG: hypothetical protein KY462_09090 [Actinobacteria bacterium]|nr:hypothetical protein [Actinomycetota bacterium]
MRRTAVGVSAAFAVALVGGTGSGVAAEDGPTVLPARQITTDLNPVRAHTQPEIAVHPDDPNTLVIVEASFLAGTCHAHVSRDGGHTWTQREARPQPDSPPSCARPAFGAFLDLEFGPDGTLYFAGAASETKGSNEPTSPYVARSDDLGETWEIAMLADGTDTAEFTDHEGQTRRDTQRFSNTRLAVHPTDPDVVYVGYRYEPATLGFDEGPRRTRIAASEDAGRSWSELVDPFANLPPDEVYGSDQPALAVAPDGTAHAFTKERPEPDAEGFPRLLATTSTDGGRSWQGRVLDDSVAICGPCLTTPEAAIDPDNGNIYVVFELSESPPPNARDDRDIWAIVSTDGGETFSDRVRLNDGLDPDRDPDNNQMFPGIDISPNGRVDVTWYDFRSDRAYNPDSRGTADHMGDLYWDVYYTYSRDGGQTWAPNVRISDRSMHRQDGYAMHVQYHLGGPISVAATDARTHVTWSDSRNGRPPDQLAEDAYYTSAVHDPSASASAVSFTSLALGGASGLVLAGLVVVAMSLAMRRSSS